MKRVSIIWKVTLWYTAFLCLLACMVVAVTYVVSERLIKRESRGHLIRMVDEVIEELEYDDGVVEADDDIDFLDQGVYLSVYDEQNSFLLGMVPKNYDIHQTFPTETVQKIMISNQQWYVYEKHTFLEEYGIVRVRGMVSAMGGGNPFIITRVLVILSPILLFVATFGGYVLTKQAFRPVTEMRRTVEQISSGKDLTRRVNLGEGEDEIYQLGKTFNQMFERLEKAFHRERQFTSDVSHELRTPISVILSQCEYALEQEDEVETAAALKSIYHQTKRMSQMVSQLLLLSRSDQGVVALSLEEVMLSELLEVIAEDAEERAKGKRIKIITEIEQEIVIRGDETMLVRFFVNLIQNAISYGKEDGWIRVSLKRQGERVIGSVADNGIGIAKEQQEKVWQRFYQVDPSRTKKEEGNSGLGLSMVQWIAAAHEGEVSLESELGKGSIFSFWFPVEGPKQK